MGNIYLDRRNKISAYMRNGDMCILFSGTEIRMSRDQHYDFVVNKNFFYLTGIDKDKLVLFLTKVNGKIK